VSKKKSKAVPKLIVDAMTDSIGFNNTPANTSELQCLTDRNRTINIGSNVLVTTHVRVQELNVLAPVVVDRRIVPDYESALLTEETTRSL
jgi:hypothetical protein